MFEHPVNMLPVHVNFTSFHGTVLCPKKCPLQDSYSYTCMHLNPEITSRKLLFKVLVIALDETTEIVFDFHEKRLFIFLTLSKIDIDSNALS